MSEESVQPEVEEKQPEAAANDGAIALGIGTVTVQEISRHPAEVRSADPNSVLFNVKYPKDYPAEKKHMKEGQIRISKELAEQFTNLKIGAVAK